MTPKLRAIIAHETPAANPTDTAGLAYVLRNALGSIETRRTRLTVEELSDHELKPHGSCPPRETPQVALIPVVDRG
jgi:hypothetical protein